MKTTVNYTYKQISDGRTFQFILPDVEGFVIIPRIGDQVTVQLFDYHLTTKWRVDDVLISQQATSADVHVALSPIRT